MSSSSRRPIRSPDLRAAPSAGPSSSNRHGSREFEMRRHSSSRYWDTVINPTDDDIRAGRSSKAVSRSPSPRECAVCRRSFSSSRALEEHQFICSSNEKPYQCEECGTSFKKNSNLVKHMKLVHRGEKNFPCLEPGCGRMFGQKSNLNSHVKAVHLGEKPFVCQEPGCEKRFSQKSGLKAHDKTVHKGERPYKCECGSSFGHRGDLNRHIRVLHEKQRPFECKICPEPKAFGRKSVLMRHMLTHQSDFPDVDGDITMTEASSSSSPR